eukprot:ANDGO_00707.mRNA.1 hypothetical protein
MSDDYSFSLSGPASASASASFPNKPQMQAKHSTSLFGNASSSSGTGTGAGAGSGSGTVDSPHRRPLLLNNRAGSGREMTDRPVILGLQGRRTGLEIAPSSIQKDADGLDSIDAYFEPKQSQPPSQSQLRSQPAGLHRPQQQKTRQPSEQKRMIAKSTYSAVEDARDSNNHNNSDENGGNNNADRDGGDDDDDAGFYHLNQSGFPFRKQKKKIVSPVMGTKNLIKSRSPSTPLDLVASAAEKMGSDSPEIALTKTKKKPTASRSTLEQNKDAEQLKTGKDRDKGLQRLPAKRMISESEEEDVIDANVSGTRDGHIDDDDSFQMVMPKRKKEPAKKQSAKTTAERTVVPPPAKAAKKTATAKRTVAAPKQQQKSLDVDESFSGDNNEEDADASFRIPVEDVSDDDNMSGSDAGFRRSRRHRIQPVNWWKGEQPVYVKEDASGVTLKEIIKAPPSDVKPKPKKRPQRSSGNGNASSGSSKIQLPASRDVPIVVRKKGAAQSFPVVSTFDHELDQFVESSAEYSRSAVFETGHFTCGSLIVARNAAFSNSMSNDADIAGKRCALVCFIRAGAARVTIHETAVELNRGCYFMIPPKNSFSVETLSTSSCEIVYFKYGASSEEA